LEEGVGVGAAAVADCPPLNALLSATRLFIVSLLEVPSSGSPRDFKYAISARTVDNLLGAAPVAPAAGNGGKANPAGNGGKANPAAAGGGAEGALSILHVKSDFVVKAFVTDNGFITILSQKFSDPHSVHEERGYLSFVPAGWNHTESSPPVAFINCPREVSNPSRWTDVT
jgi:hypothetical protein